MDASTNPPSNAPIAARGRAALSSVQTLTRQPAVRRALPAIVILSMAVIGMAAYLLLTGPTRLALNTGLPEAEKAAALDTLTAAGVDAILDPATGVIKVAESDFYQARMTLAAAGLPQGTQDGYSVLSDMPLGTSRSVESARLRQMQELELARSISEIQAVSAARVHLALPERTAFVRDTQPPQASVFLQLRPGYMVDAQQVQAIVSLVAASVPGMARGNVSVVDQTGRLLSNNSDDPITRMTDQQLQYQMQLEQVYRTRIEELITPLVGFGNAAVGVTVDIDFTRSELTEEQVDPDAVAIRSISEQTEQNSTPQARGIPGAVANTPPDETTLAEDFGGAAGAETSTSTSSSSTRNYEVSRKVQSTVLPTNRIIRVNAAVLLRQPDGVAADGTPLALPAAVLEDVERLTRSAISFDAARGDTVTVSSQRFVETLQMAEPVFYQEPWFRDLARQAAQLIALAIVVLGVVRPILTRVLAQPEPDMTDASAYRQNWVEVGEGESLSEVRARLNDFSADLGPDTSASYEEKVQLVRQFAAGESSQVANVFQNMIDSDHEKA